MEPSPAGNNNSVVFLDPLRFPDITNKSQSNFLWKRHIKSKDIVLEHAYTDLLSRARGFCLTVLPFNIN